MKVLKAKFGRLRFKSNFLIQHNLPIATADHLGLLFKQVFPDSKIAST